MLARVASLLAVLAVASAIPSLNLPTVAPSHGFNTTASVVEDKLHSEFVAWKAKVMTLHKLVTMRAGDPGQPRWRGI